MPSHIIVCIVHVICDEILLLTQSAYPISLLQNLAPDENHAKACDYIRQAAAQGAVLAVLPE